MRETFGITAASWSKMINDLEIKDDVQRNKENYLSYVFFSRNAINLILFDLFVRGLLFEMSIKTSAVSTTLTFTKRNKPFMLQAAALVLNFSVSRRH